MQAASPRGREVPATLALLVELVRAVDARLHDGR